MPVTELLTDRSWELGTASWSYSGSGERVMDGTAPDGSWVAKVHSTNLGLVGSVTQEAVQLLDASDITQGFRFKVVTHLEIPGWLNWLRVESREPGGGWVTRQSLKTEDYSIGVWQQAAPVIWSPGDTELDWRVRAETLGSGFGFASVGIWHLDLASLAQDIPDVDTPETRRLLMKRGKWNAVKALQELFTTLIVGGPDYHNDLGGRCYTRLITPEEHDGIVKPYLCLPVIDEGQEYSQTGSVLTTTFNQRVFLFSDDTAAHSKLTSNGTQTIGELHDDVLKALMVNPTLTRLLNAPAQVLTCNSAAGMDDSGYAEAEMLLQLSMNIGIDDLGPLAQQ